MAIVLVSPFNVVSYPEGGGHFWVYLQYVKGLRRLGCEVYWLERFYDSGDAAADDQRLAAFSGRMETYGLGEKLILYRSETQARDSCGALDYVGMTRSQAETILGRADLLLNFQYAIDPTLLARVRRTALIDIDPGLLQYWMSNRQIVVPRHDVYFTTGETVGTPSALFPDCGLSWIRIRPPVCLESWPFADTTTGEAFTTVSHWQGHEWITVDGELIDNNKCASFLPFVALPSRTDQPLELALKFGQKLQDAQDKQFLESHGWRVRRSEEVSATPELYQSYVRGSRGEFSCAKASCMKFQNAWISDRTLCYLASGRPAVVQHTGPSAYLPNGEGLYRFSTVEEAAAALETVNVDYERQRRAARNIAETYFDARQILETVLNAALA